MGRNDVIDGLKRTVIVTVIALVIAFAFAFVTGFVKGIFPIEWGGILVAIVGLALLTFAVNMRPGKEEALPALITAFTIGVTLSIIAKFIQIPALAVFDLNLGLTLQGIIILFGIVFFAEAVQRKYLKALA